jgi:hypothetical protein
MGECRMQARRELCRIVVRPEMHEEEVRRLLEHVTVNRSYLDSILA